MTRLLHIQGSPRGERSRSANIAATFLARLAERRPDLQVETLNVWQADLPAFAGPEIEARYAVLHGIPASAEQAGAWAGVAVEAERFAGFDAYLVSTPMWNFGLPYRLKQYVDLITQPGALFSAIPEGQAFGALTGKRAWLIATSAWTYGPESGVAHLDFQASYLRAWFGFCGIAELQAVLAAPMFGPQDVVEAAVARAKLQAEALADAV